MSTFTFPEGSAFYFSSTFAGAKTVSAVTNANPAVATSTSHGYVDNDLVLFTSGWEDATDTIYKVDQQDANSFQLLGLNTTSTSFFAAGSGTGTTQAVSSWTQIPGVFSIATQGGDARFTPINLLARRNATQVATGFNAASMTLTIAYDPTATAWSTMLDLSRTLTKVGFRLVLSGGAQMLAYGYMSLSEFPSMAVNQANSVQLAMTFLNKPVSYSS